LGIFVALVFLLFIPFPTLVYASFFVNSTNSFSLLFAVSLTSVILFYAAAILQTKKGLGLSVGYALLGPIGSFIIVLAFGSGILKARSSSAVTWRGRNYSMVDKPQNSINV